jgi:hypothetical protein
MTKKLPSHLRNDSCIYQLRTVQEHAIISMFSVTTLVILQFSEHSTVGLQSLLCAKKFIGLLMSYHQKQLYIYYVTIS